MANYHQNCSEQLINQLLAALPDVEWSRLKLHLQQVMLEARTVLHARHQSLDHVYFPQRGYISLMVDFSDGFQAEVGQVGSEGMLGVSLAYGAKAEGATAVVQTPGVALRMPAEAFARELKSLPTLEQLLLQYGEALRAQAAQLAACNGHHGLDARLARCLLSIQDRSGSSSLPVTHEMLASLLCAHRPSVSVTAKRLQQSGLIRYAAGALVIVDRAGLERAACECYQIVRDTVGTSRPQGA